MPRRTVKVHFSTIKLAEVFEELLGLEDYEAVQRFVRVSEAKDAQSINNAAEEQVALEAVTPAGIAEDDIDPDQVV